ncbi:hypothetical protein, partial [Neisseria sp. P0017.S004]|uniref:hypothetical protein n=1 Tax=Neisseria sp. P0017.S004 TaxID=3436780 RepID=UPI003F801025
ETCQHFDQVLAEMCGFKGVESDEFGGYIWCVGKDKSQQQKNLHGCCHYGIYVFRPPVSDFNILNVQYTP